MCFHLELKDGRTYTLTAEAIVAALQRGGAWCTEPGAPLFNGVGGYAYQQESHCEGSGKDAHGDVNESGRVTSGRFIGGGSSEGRSVP
jgi:hypothetical protein